MNRYIKPSIKVQNMEIDNAILAASGEMGKDPKDITFGNTLIDPTAALSKKHNSSLWDSDYPDEEDEENN